MSRPVVRFFKTVGKTTALAAIASVLPIATLQEAAAIDTLKPEKKVGGYWLFYPFYAQHRSLWQIRLVIMQNKASKPIY